MANEAEHSPLNRTEGFALVLTLLFTGIVLLIVVSTAASLATGTRQGGANERRAYQAMLVAESGINTLPRRAGEYVRTVPYTGSSTTEMQTWLTGFKTYIQNNSPVTGNTLTLTALTGSTFNASSKGSTGLAVKIIAQDYLLNDRILPPALRPRSAVTSLPAISANGSATVSADTANGGPVTTVATAASLPANVASTTVTVTDASGLRVGDYVQMGTSTFKVTGISGNVLNITRVPGTSSSAQTMAKNSNVNLLISAVAASYASVTTSMDIKLSDARDYLVGETVGIAGGSATITALNLSTNVATITWNSGKPSTLPEGTQVLRDVAALRSAGTITPKSNKLDAYTGTVNGVTTNDCATATTCRGQNDPLLTPTGTSANFTQMMLGLSDQELNDLVPLYSGSYPIPSGGIVRINGANFDNAVKNSNFTGVLIVDGDINSSLNGNTTLNGFIYVRGSTIKFVNGNFTLNGALAVRGSSASTSTDITGNLTVNYSAVGLRTAFLNSAGSKELDTLAGTWRQQ
ncbi:hypothetical protein E7T09_02050 [Deinococcus sp. KSM4-11]|uniref:PilX N-terminal domain-containing pilus assembly protein n=1 Tax=Deinococcus sp. KSM4-11 TaxID=2568654 RepID=UPI0010A53C22|nr:pilus assembly PilX N-terminal domain-containing protein [Deinococcus sp. KSM4-11]THF88027.1 hypothetical protein E7T09_02050 [Deinococcus sp. KSM4-11]